MRLLAATVLALLLATPAAADYEAGRRALEAGHTDIAIAEWQSAAVSGDREAMLALGRLHAQGLGVLQDYVEAHKWFNLAASRGAVEGVQERDALLAFMTPGQIEVAQRRAAEWLAEAAPPEGTAQPTITAEPGASEPAEQAAAEPVAEADPAPPSPEEIREAQTLLAELGYAPGAADGKWGPRSVRAYAAFLGESALPAEEGLSPEGLQAMRDEAYRRREEQQAAAPLPADSASAAADAGAAGTTLSTTGPSTAETIATVANLVIQGLQAYQLAKLARDAESFALVAPELQTLLTKMLTGLSASDLSDKGDASVALGALTPQERGQLSTLLEDDRALPAETRAALSDALGATSASSVAFDPKCADLPGQYLDENHAECWVEFENQPGCFRWTTHYHSDQNHRWSGQCRGGIAEGQGTLSETAGSNHDAWEGTGTLSGGKLNGRWIEQWADGDRSDAEYRDGKVNGFGTYTTADGYRYEGEWRDSKKNGRGIETWADGDRYEGEFVDGKRTGQGTYLYPGGSRYEGEWRDGKRTGQGTYFYPSGTRYEGEWRDSKRNGRGTEFFYDGSRFEGEWRDDKRNGRGTGFLSDDEPWRTCEFRNDEAVDGTCTYH